MAGIIARNVQFSPAVARSRAQVTGGGLLAPVMPPIGLPAGFNLPGQQLFYGGESDTRNQDNGGGGGGGGGDKDSGGGGGDKDSKDNLDPAGTPPAVETPWGGTWTPPPGYGIPFSTTPNGTYQSAGGSNGTFLGQAPGSNPIPEGVFQGVNSGRLPPVENKTVEQPPNIIDPTGRNAPQTPLNLTARFGPLGEESSPIPGEGFMQYAQRLGFPAEYLATAAMTQGYAPFGTSWYSTLKSFYG